MKKKVSAIGYSFLFFVLVLRLLSSLTHPLTRTAAAAVKNKMQTGRNEKKNTQKHSKKKEREGSERRRKASFERVRERLKSEGRQTERQRGRVSSVSRVSRLLSEPPEKQESRVRVTSAEFERVDERVRES